MPWKKCGGLSAGGRAERGRAFHPQVTPWTTAALAGFPPLTETDHSHTCTVVAPQNGVPRGRCCYTRDVTPAIPANPYATMGQRYGVAAPQSGGVTM